ncbi:LOW QUALITY PROTEIN: hypothetical protein Cgig2_009841 [Carnegiea gigantea]|uniref:Uncharacterized protein n=1 Tax=Carnegiea gigantea TaxID=171969 RepID=A0A9Q1KMC7_9CARY|nr:LOW QUALITY PROTEIN: hypothetical protein Cgig2_009841 [Carnegiea gigantea]
METHDMGTVDVKTGWVVGRDELDDDYDCCILPPTNGRQPGRPPSKHRDEVGHMMHTYRNPRADFNANYEGDVVEIYWMIPTFHVVKPHQIAIHRCSQFTDSFALCSYWIVSYEHTPTPICVLMIKYNFACSPLSGNLKCLPERRQMFVMVNHGLQPINLWVTVALQSWHFDILIILDSELSPHPHPCLEFNVQVYWCISVGGWYVYPCLCINDEVRLYIATFY